MSNAERQRLFQARHPGYDRRRKARQRASAKRMAAPLEPEFAAQIAAQRTAQLERELLVIPVPTTRLALPAPVEMPLLPAINDLHALLAAARQQRVAA